jgi:putative copper export protein
MLLVLRVVMRTVHLVAASAWVGGSIFYLVALLPGLRAGGPAPQVAARVARQFRQIVNVCMGALLVSGVYLTFDRLTNTTLGTAYVVVLGLKIAVALGLFALALYQAQEGVSRLRAARNRAALWKATPRLILALGLLAFVLGTVLTSIYELSAVA